MGPAAGEGAAAALVTRPPRTQPLRSLMKHRLVHDFAAILVADGLFERHPACGSPTSRTAARGSGICSTDSRFCTGRTLACSRRTPPTSSRALLGGTLRRGQRPELWRNTCRWSGSCSAPTGRTPRVGHPRDFFHNVEEFSLADQRKIMRDNARDLTRPETAIDGVA